MSKLQESKVAARYAKALFEGALAAGQLEVVSGDLEAVTRLFADVPKLKEFFANPAIPAAEKSAFVAQQIAPKLSPWTGNLLKLMVDNSRVSAFAQLTQQFQKLVNQHHNVTDAEVITAVELDDKLAARLQKSLQERFGFNTIHLHNRVEPGILGGVIVKIQDQIIDGSYSGKLEALKRQLAS